jgi:penicillin-binding protein 2
MNTAVLLIFTFLSACGNGGSILPAADPTATLAKPAVYVTRAPEPISALDQFTQAWQIGNYEGMYALLSIQSQNALALEDFAARYRDAMNALTLRELKIDLFTPVQNTDTAQIPFRVTYNTNVIDDLVRDMTAALILEHGNWRIVWDDGLILPELKGGNRLSMDFESVTRGSIYDVDGDVIAGNDNIVAFGIVPGELNPDSEGYVLNTLYELTGTRPNNIRELYELAGPDWYVPVGEARASDVQKRINSLSALNGVVMSPYSARYYDRNGIASQSVGYVAPIPAEEAQVYQRQGYPGDARVGQSGIEQWGEDFLAGKAGGTLYVIDPNGVVLGTLGSSQPAPSSSIYLTINSDYQFLAEQALIGLRGAAVVLERDTGKVLALASSPDFDPNLFDPNNSNSGWALGNLINDEDRPLVNRATQGTYPLGSVFKVITFSAALESGAFAPETTFECQYEWNGLNDRTRYDWTYERFLKDGKQQPSGELTLAEGLMRSCNPFFWQIGLELYNSGRVTAVADMARGFGLGQATGIDAVPEAEGTIQNPETVFVAVNEAIGQDPVLVTPLQVARFTAAIGNGGTLYRPQIVDRVIDSTGIATPIFKPEAQGVLPINPTNLKALQDAMLQVVENPRGTASHRFRNFSIPVHGKTGTAESGIPELPHAWFAGYTDAQIEGVPDIAIAVIVENKGEGSEYGAPVFRRLVELYFFGKPQVLYWWESDFNITRTPTPSPTITPFGFETSPTPSE